MVKELKLEFYRALNKLSGKDYLACIIAYEAAPTIKNKKPSSLITFSKKGKNLLSLWKTYREEIMKALDLEYFELKETNESIIVLFYNKRMLESCVVNKRNIDFMKRMGYKDDFALRDKLKLLSIRFNDLCPHEIGIFLGIPIEDVEGFIRHKGNGCLMCKYWKVYSNIKRAELLFNIYDEARLGVISKLLKTG